MSVSGRMLGAGADLKHEANAVYHQWAILPLEDKRKALVGSCMFAAAMSTFHQIRTALIRQFPLTMISSAVGFFIPAYFGQIHAKDKEDILT